MDDISSIVSSPTRTARLAIVAMAVLVALSAASGCTRQDGTEGKPLPDVELTSLTTGKPASWDADGRPMVINFWASWCTPCRAEMPAFEEVHQRLGDQVAIVGVTDEDDHEASAEAAEAAGVTYPLLVDDDQVLLSDLRVSGLPGTVFVDADGNVVGRHLGALTEAQLIQEIEDRYDIAA